MDAKWRYMRSRSGTMPVMRAERLRRLRDEHAAAVDGGAARTPGLPQQFRLKRTVDDGEHPHVRPQQAGRKRRSTVGHADRRAQQDHHRFHPPACYTN
jgi:hypothetical protein